MALIETLPKALEATLRGPKENGAELVVAGASDLNDEGVLGDEWLVIKDEHVRVYALNGQQAQARLGLELSKLNQHGRERWNDGVAVSTNTCSNSADTRTIRS